MIKFNGKRFKEATDPELINMLKEEQRFLEKISQTNKEKLRNFVERFEEQTMMTKKQMERLAYITTNKYIDIMRSLNDARADLEIESEYMDEDVKLFEYTYNKSPSLSLVVKRFQQARKTFLDGAQQCVELILGVLKETEELVSLKGASEWMNILIKKLQDVIESIYDKERKIEDDLLAKLNIESVREQTPVRLEDIYEL